MDNPETQATFGTRNRMKTNDTIKHNTKTNKMHNTHPTKSHCHRYYLYRNNNVILRNLSHL